MNKKVEQGKRAIIQANNVISNDSITGETKYIIHRTMVTFRADVRELGNKKEKVRLGILEIDFWPRNLVLPIYRQRSKTNE